MDAVRARIDPSLADGLYAGAASSHADAEGAKAIGLPKPYGYGASMGAWILDYAAARAGELGFITHSDVQYRFPALEGDVTYVDGRIGRTGPGAGGSTLVAVEVTMSNQRGLVLAKGSVDVTL